eukprot:scaffold23107_cov28-Tisochrysis_lutea.AAC.1
MVVANLPHMYLERKGSLRATRPSSDLAETRLFGWHSIPCSPETHETFHTANLAARTNRHASRMLIVLLRFATSARITGQRLDVQITSIGIPRPSLQCTLGRIITWSTAPRVSLPLHQLVPPTE